MCSVFLLYYDFFLNRRRHQRRQRHCEDDAASSRNGEQRHDLHRVGRAQWRFDVICSRKTRKENKQSPKYFMFALCETCVDCCLCLCLSLFSRRRQPAIDRFTWRRNPTSLRRRVSTAVSWALYIYNKKFSLSNYSLLYCRTVSLLVRRGADLSATNAAGESAIVVARKCGSTRCVSILEVRNAA